MVRIKSAYHHGDLRKALLAAAEAELDEKGLEGFSLRGVARRAGVSHAAPAHHFKDTAAMLTALATVAAERLTRSLRKHRDLAGKDARDRIVASGVGYVSFALENPALFKLLFGSERPDSDDPELVEQAARAFQILTDDLAELRGNDPMAEEEGTLDTAALWSAVHGIASLLIANRMRFLGPMLAEDRDATLARLIRRTLPR
ncbi:MAG TPA: WHG domain-containing protein [Rhizobiaceae bacterium]|nr:WHG domain-containing protein [Rhizobiaceae bacterium]